jgi:hypothetical protein
MFVKELMVALIVALLVAILLVMVPAVVMPGGHVDGEEKEEGAGEQAEPVDPLLVLHTQGHGTLLPLYTLALCTLDQFACLGLNSSWIYITLKVRHQVNAVHDKCSISPGSVSES